MNRHLEYLDLATCLEDLKVPPSNSQHALKGDRKGQFAISINDQWRISKLFGNTPEFWLNAQRAVDLWKAQKESRREIERIKPLQAA
jgi:plasmid maintenance system antidote protein VapI